MKLFDAIKSSPLRLIQLTDCHLGADTDYELSGINTSESLKDVLANIAENGLVTNRFVVTGDISCNGFDASYQLFSDILGDQPPYCWLPGNHDHFNAMKSYLPVPYEQLLSVGGWNLLMVNSANFGRVEGNLPETELAAMGQHLAANANTPTLIFMHHPPVNVGCRWLDRQKIANARKLFDLLGKNTQVKGVFCGHVHQEQQVGQLIPVYTAPSTCFQFKSNSDEFALSSQPPGYRWIDLYKDGTFQTGTEYLANFSQVPDKHCMGY